MPAIGAIVSTSIWDKVMWSTSATVSQDRIYNPAGFISPGVHRWEDRAGGIAVGYPWVTQHIRRPTQDSRLYKVSFKFGDPRLATTSPSTNTGIEPAPSKAYELQCHMDWMLPERSTLAERSAFAQRVASFFAVTLNASDAVPTNPTSTPFWAAIESFETVY